MNTRFIIQSNLIAENDFKEIQSACIRNNIDFEEVTVIPFVKELPSFTMDERENIYYGSTTFIDNVYNTFKPNGIFFDPDAFLISNYIDKWGDRMLNSEAKITTINDFIMEDHHDKDVFFIRPNKDDKSFDGNVMEFGKIRNWQNSILQFDDTKLMADSKIIVSKPYNIKKEWRFFVVNGDVVSGSLYRQNFKLKKSKHDIPDDVVNFVRNRLIEYQPAKAFVMDIANCGDEGEYYIIECGCINSVGFYHANIEKIIVSLATLFE